MESSLYQSTSSIIRSPTPTRNHCLSPGVMLQSHVEPLMGKSRVTLPSAPVLTSQPITGFPVPCFPAARTSANWASSLPLTLMRLMWLPCPPPTLLLTAPRT